MTSTVWVVSLNTRNDGRDGGGGAYRAHKKHGYHSMTYFLTHIGCDLFGVSFITSLKSKLRTALSTQNTTEKNCIMSHAQNTTAVQVNILLTGVHRLLVTNKGLSALPSSNHCQGRLQTPQQLSIVNIT
jgi:hypothetical protein